MKFYTLTYEIVQASGTQTYRVKANSEAEAIKKCNDGKADCIDEHIEIEEVSEDPINVEVDDSDNGI